MDRPTGPARIVALVWYRRDQWDRVRACSSDRDDMAENYDDWERRAKETEQRIAATGGDARRVDVDVEALISWAARKGLDINGTTRGDYAGLLLGRLLGMKTDV